MEVSPEKQKPVDEYGGDIHTFAKERHMIESDTIEK
jgi:hypothetical protein